MSEVTPIRPDVSVPEGPKGKRRAPRGSGPTVPVRAMNDALTDQRAALFQAMGIVRMASHAIQEPQHRRADTDAWTALDGAYELLSSIADRLECAETMLAEEAPRRSDY
jgi:hypothetical protein